MRTGTTVITSQKISGILVLKQLNEQRQDPSQLEKHGKNKQRWYLRRATMRVIEVRRLQGSVQEVYFLCFGRAA